MQRGQHRRKAATNHCAYNAEGGVVASGAASVVCEKEDTTFVYEEEVTFVVQL